MDTKLRVTTYRLNIRSTPEVPPGNPNLNRITTINIHFVVDKLNDSPDGKWTLVQFDSYDGIQIQGWASNTYLAPLDAALFAPDIPAWLKIAVNELGIREFHGSEDNPRIVTYMKTTRLENVIEGSAEAADLDFDIAWCSAFANFCMNEAGYEGPANAHYARSWLSWNGGQPIDNPRLGCITVFRRADDPENEVLGHVGFFVRSETNSIYVLGGNQGTPDQVNVFPYETIHKLGYIWPLDTPIVP